MKNILVGTAALGFLSWGIASLARLLTPDVLLWVYLIIIVIPVVWLIGDIVLQVIKEIRK